MSWPADLRQALAHAAEKAMSDVLQEAVRLARRALGPGGGGPRSQSGALSRSLSYRVTRNGDTITGSLETDSPYAWVHEKGAVIQAKKAEYLRFRVGGRWANKKRVEIPARPFMRPSLEKALEQLPERLQARLAEEFR